MKEKKNQVSKRVLTTKKKIAFFLLFFFVLFCSDTYFEDIVSFAENKGIHLNVKKKTVQKGKTFVIKCKGTKKKVKWSVSKKKIVSIKKKGKYTIKLKAKKCGKTVVTAKVGKIKRKCVVTVKKNKKGDTYITTAQNPTIEKSTTEGQTTQTTTGTPTTEGRTTQTTTETPTTEEQTTIDTPTSEETTTEETTQNSTVQEPTTEEQLQVHAVPASEINEEPTKEELKHRDNEAQKDIPSSFSFPTYKGEGTFYGGGYGGGCCCLDSMTNGYYVCAMNRPQYNTGMMSGAYIEVTGPIGSIKVLVADELPEGKTGDIDMNTIAFPKIAKVEDGRVPISWKIVPFPTDEPIKYWIKKDSTQYWMQIQIRNQRYPIAKLELQKEDGSFVEVPKRNYNFFEIGAAGIGEPGKGPYVFRVTDINGQVLTDTIPLMPGYVIDGKANFPY